MSLCILCLVLLATVLLGLSCLAIFTTRHNPRSPHTVGASEEKSVSPRARERSQSACLSPPSEKFLFKVHIFLSVFKAFHDKTHFRRACVALTLTKRRCFNQSVEDGQYIAIFTNGADEGKAKLR
ncbi:hypothetical protein Ae201684P_011454 [Aphanomyces euteiches]|nr:hypothetical protein Ae201684P_011454 [Aphanomyces euteiches]